MVNLSLAALVMAVALMAGGAGAARAATTGSTSTFSYGELPTGSPGTKGCGTNVAGEPAIHVSRANNVFLGSENGLGGGSQLWRGLGAVGGAGASGCGLEYRGQPNAVSGIGLSGGDIDLAIASAPNPAGNYNVYVASLNLGSVYTSTSKDNGQTFATQRPLSGGIPVDDREWIAAFGSSTALLSYHDIATNNIDVLRSNDAGSTYIQQSRVIPDTDYKAQNNELGNLVIDHRNLPPGGQFYAYQSFVAPKSANDSTNDEAFLGVSSDGGKTWADRPIPCSVDAGKGLDHNFPNVSVDPAGNIWYAWSDDQAVYTAKSSDHGATWSCSGPVSTGLKRAIFPWLAATSNGVDLVYYGTRDANGPNMTWSAEFAQNLSGAPTGWSGPQGITTVHRGDVCEGGVSCTGGRQLLDDFGVDTDSLGYAHIAYSHDFPDLGGGSSYTGHAVQTSGTPVGSPNN